MGCSSSLQENFRKINIWEPQIFESKNKSFPGSRTGKERVLFPENHQGRSLGFEWSCNKSANEGQIMDQKKIEKFRENPKIEHSVSWDLKAEGSLSEAIDLLRFSEISDCETSSSSVCLNDMKEDAWEVPIGFKPGTTNKSQRNALYLDIAKTNGQHKPNPLAVYAMMNRALSYNYPSGRELIGQKADDILKRWRANHYDHISGYTFGPCKSSRNRSHAGNSSGAQREWQSTHDTINPGCKSMQTRIPNYEKIFKDSEKYGTSLNDTYRSSTEPGSCGHVETEGMYKTNRPTEENSEYPENESSASLSTDSSVYLLRKKLNAQKFIVAKLFLQTLQC